MNVEIVKSKIHRVKVTGADLNYIGSITIDKDQWETHGNSWIMQFFSIIFFDFEESGERKVMKIGVKIDKRGKERLREQKNEYNRVKETPERAPGTPKVRFT